MLSPLISIDKQRFSIIMAFCEPASPRRIWERIKHFIITDFRRRHPGAFQNDNFVEEYVLNEIRTSLYKISPVLTLEPFNIPRAPVRSYDMPFQHSAPLSNADDIKSIISCTEKFRKEQRNVFNTILGEILPGVTADNPEAPVQRPFNHYSLRPCSYFLDAPGGTEKTFTIRAVQSALRLRKHKVIAVATSAVAASLLEDGQTAHSAFKIPIPCHADSVCNISLESEIAHRLRSASLIIWNEIVMCLRHCIEAVDRTLQVVMKSPNVPFVGKCVLFSRDFRQILPVVPRGSRGMIVFICFQSSPLHQYMSFLSLSENMRLQSIRDDEDPDPAVFEYPNFPMKVGKGKLKQTEGSFIELPSSVNIFEYSKNWLNPFFQIGKKSMLTCSG